MKKKLLTLILCIASITSYAQSTFVPFEEGIRWRIDLSTSISSPALTCTGTSHYHFFLLGDTTVLSNTYKKVFRSDIYESTYTGQPNCYPYPEYATSGYAGALLNDSVANNVRFIPAYSPGTSEVLLYDYALSVGDTINSAMVLCDRVVTAIDTINIGGIERKRWHYVNCSGDAAYYIEGLGSSHGVIEPTGFSYMSSVLICIQQNDSTIFNSGIASTFGCYSVFAGIEKGEPLEIALYPNPASESVILMHPSTAERIGIELINQLGQQLPVAVTHTATQSEVNTSALENGSYLLRITVEGTVFSKHLLVKHD